MRRTVVAIYVALASAASARAADPTTRPYAIAPDHPAGVYAAGEPIAWSIDWAGDGPPPAAKYVVLAGQATSVGNGAIEWHDRHARVTATLADAGSALLKVTFDGIKDDGLGGAIVAPEQVRPSAKKPDDFDAFWDAKLAELKAVDPNPQLTPVDVHKPGVDYWHVTLDNVRGIKIQGQLARPHDGEKFPAIFIPQWAGVYALDPSWATDRAAQGFLALNISAHDLPIDRDPAFYKRQFDGPLNNYWAIGNEDPDQSYFLHMYLSCVRGVEYLKSRPDWDGKTLVVFGASQGGMQGLVTAALEANSVTATIVDVPAGCDMLGPTVGRKGGWPQWYDITWGGRDAAKVRAASEYYDVGNFADRIKCPVVIGAGLIDQTCPVAGIGATANQISSPVEVLYEPLGEHVQQGDSHGRWDRAAWGVWLPSLARGVVPPLKD